VLPEFWLPCLAISNISTLRRSMVSLSKHQVVGSQIFHLPCPLQRQRLHQHCQSHLRRLPPIQDRLDDVRRQQGQPQDARHVGFVDLLGGGDFGDGRVGAILEAISRALNDRGIRSARGATWHVSSVANVLARSQNLAGLR
jgi:hypothetical protein